jgi:hypothetical protein
MKPNKHFQLYALPGLVLLFSLVAAFLNYSVSRNINADSSLVLLAGQFLHGHISLAPTQSLPLGDLAAYGGKFYLYFGPFSSIVLMPAVFLFGLSVSQNILGLSALIVSFFSVLSLAAHLKFSRLHSFWLALFYVFSTVLLSSGLINITAYQVEAVGSMLVLLAVTFYITRKNPWLTGIALGLAVLTRVTLVLSLLFFLPEFIKKRLTLREAAAILVPVLFCLALFGLYNRARFHSWTETGYKYNITLKSFPLSENLKYGYMSPAHIPANVYSLFLMPPQPVTMDARGFVLKYPYLKVSPWGLAIWYTSPLFLVLFVKRKKGLFTGSAVLAMAALGIPLILYYSIGFAQFGYRYTLDFLPFLFLILAHCLRSDLTRTEIALIIAGVVFNAVFLMSSWNRYPLLGI